MACCCPSAAAAVTAPRLRVHEGMHASELGGAGSHTLVMSVSDAQLRCTTVCSSAGGAGEGGRGPCRRVRSCRERLTGSEGWLLPTSTAAAAAALGTCTAQPNTFTARPCAHLNGAQARPLVNAAADAAAAAAAAARHWWWPLHGAPAAHLGAAPAATGNRAPCLKLAQAQRVAAASVLSAFQAPHLTQPVENTGLLRDSNPFLTPYAKE